MSQSKVVVDQRIIGAAPNGDKYVQITMDPRTTVQQFAQMCQLSNGCGMMMRVCDGCKRGAGQGSIECSCNNPKCLQHYDLCPECQPKFKTNMCPPGYGCGNIN